jgi:hypothetical protein
MYTSALCRGGLKELNNLIACTKVIQVAIPSTVSSWPISRFHDGTEVPYQDLGGCGSEGVCLANVIPQSLSFSRGVEGIDKSYSEV